jgi:hypothetical protein
MPSPRLTVVLAHDLEAAAPRVLTAQPEVFAAVSAENERSWEGLHRCADTAWDAVVAWTARVGQPLDFTLRGGWLLVSRGDGPAAGRAGPRPPARRAARRAPGRGPPAAAAV